MIHTFLLLLFISFQTTFIFGLFYFQWIEDLPKHYLSVFCLFTGHFAVCEGDDVLFCCQLAPTVSLNNNTYSNIESQHGNVVAL